MALNILPLWAVRLVNDSSCQCCVRHWCCVFLPGLVARWESLRWCWRQWMDTRRLSSCCWIWAVISMLRYNYSPTAVIGIFCKHNFMPHSAVFEGLCMPTCNGHFSRYKLRLAACTGMGRCQTQVISITLTNELQLLLLIYGILQECKWCRVICWCYMPISLFISFLLAHLLYVMSVFCDSQEQQYWSVIIRQLCSVSIHFTRTSGSWLAG